MTEQMKQPEPAPAPAPQPEPAPQPQPQPEPMPQPEPAPQPANAYESIIEQQQQQITALMEQTKMLNEQIVNLVNNGAQLNQANMLDPQNSLKRVGIQFNQPSLENQEDYTLESLAKDIGKKPKRV